MADYEIIGTAGKYRAKLIRDEYPEEPYDDGASPILAYSFSPYGGRLDVEQGGTGTSYKIHPRIIEAFEHFQERADRGEAFERYLRLFHGVTEVEWYAPGMYQGEMNYVSFDPADWREKMGLTDEHLASVRAKGDEISIVNMNEWRAYCEGEVYGWAVEELVSWTGDNGHTRETWEVMDSCWGFYGETKYPTEEALSALADLLEFPRTSPVNTVLQAAGWVVEGG